MILFLLFLVGQSSCQEVTTPSSLLRPKHFNHHAFDAEQYLKSLNLPVPTKQGPVLFPNDAPPAPRTPLIVTARPLIESIAKSELNPLPANNSEAQSSNNGISFVPYFGRVKEYKPFYGVGKINHFETQSPLPPIYKVIADKQKPYNYEHKVTPDYNQQRHNEIGENPSDYNQAQNYAFSYAVKDKNTGDDFSHSQHSSGSATNGEYRVRLPDGRMQIVSYTADENGYNAEVRYDDEDKTSGNAIESNSNSYGDVNSNSYGDVNSNTIKPTDYILTDYRKTDFGNNYISTTKSYDYDVPNTKSNNDYSENDYEKLKPKNDYANYDSKEFYNDDYSSEYNNNYPIYTSKFKSFNDKNNDYTSKFNSFNDKSNEYHLISSTAKPNFDDIRNLLVDEKLYNTRQSYNDVEPKQIFDSSFKNTNLFTNVNDIVAITPRSYIGSNQIATTPTSYLVSAQRATTPSSYLVSTITNLQSRITANQPIPVLSGRFIDKINKYLSF